ncbi:MAG: hypothetical protein Q7J16_07670, partial [Candidatus Cloacimonadales bacterium]|nr:hypothetical protein [Candidatus Cloacimonadales bacterium]
MVNDNNSNNNKTQTYSNDETKKTQTYSDSKKQETQKYSDTVIVKRGTITYDDNDSDLIKPVEYEGDTLYRMDKTKAHNLGVGDIVELNEIKYMVIEIISEETGEAVIYKIRDQKDSIFALKLYYQLSPKKEPNPEAFNRIKNIEDPDILRLYDYGAGENKYKDKFCFEVCDFAKGGDLLSVKNIKKKYTPAFLQSNVIPEIFKGIKRLHENRIVHCDLKPENVFYLDEEQT